MAFSYGSLKDELPLVTSEENFLKLPPSRWRLTRL
jgi:hypothetical protein